MPGNSFRLNSGLSEIIKHVNITTESLFETSNKCDENIAENLQGVTNVTKSIRDISKAVEESAAAVNNVSSYVSRLVTDGQRNLFHLRDVEKDSDRHTETILVGAREADETMQHLDIMKTPSIRPFPLLQNSERKWT